MIVLHFAEFKKCSPFVTLGLVCLVCSFIYSVKIRDFLLPQRSHFPFLTLTILSFKINLFVFDYIKSILDICLLWTQLLTFESI